MKIDVRVLSGSAELRRAINCTQNKLLPFDCKPLRQKTMNNQIKQQHGTLNRYIFEVQAVVPERVHSHLRTHHLINEFYACSTSRPDICSADGKMRSISLLLPLKRAIEIFGLRLCKKSWHETTKFFKQLKEKLVEIEPILEPILQPQCIHKGFCPEMKNSCGYELTGRFTSTRESYENIW